MRRLLLQPDMMIDHLRSCCSAGGLFMLFIESLGQTKEEKFICSPILVDETNTQAVS